MSNYALVCREVNKGYDGEEVVSQLSFAIEPSQILAVIGPSGCGKTTTLRLIAGFEKLDGGQIEIDGRMVSGDNGHLPPEKRRVGMVFQDYAIFPHLNVAQNVSFGLDRGSQALERTQQMLELVGLNGKEMRMPHELSGGQQQRIALARALAPKPAILLLDEPFSNLDTSLRSQVRTEVRQILNDSGTTAIFVTHDQEEALYIGDIVAVMNGGRFEQVGTVDEVFQRPATHFVAEFMGQTVFLAGRVSELGVETPIGLLPQPLPLPQGTDVEVAVRPDDVQIEIDPAAANGRISDRSYLGIANIYTIDLQDGTQIQSWQPHTLKLSPGTAVKTVLQPGHPLACFYQGKAV